MPTVWRVRPTDYEPNQRSYSVMLERALRSANPGREIEVVPYAVPGYSSHQGLALARRDLPEIDADVVVACYGWNDINLRVLTDRESMSIAPRQVMLRKLMMKSQALVHASTMWQRRTGPPAPPSNRGQVTRVLGQEYIENMTEIVHLAGRHGGAGIVLAPVYRDSITVPDESQRLSAHRALLRDAMKTAQIPYLEIEALTEAGWPQNEWLFGEKIHPGYLGHRLMAQELLTFMAERQMLKDLKLPPPEAVH